MKTRFAIAIIIGLAGLCAPGVKAVVSPNSAPLANFDKREEALKQSPAKASALLTSGTAQAKAAAAFQARVPNARISEDKILGTPAFITANGFLTDAGGRGKAVSASSLAAIPAGDPHRVIKAFLNEHSAMIGHDAGALDSATVKRDYVTENNGLRTVVWEQTLDGVPVFDGLLVGHITKDEELVSLSDHFVPDASKAADLGVFNRKALQDRPKISAAQAVVLAASNLGVELKENQVVAVDGAQGAEKRQALTADGLSSKAEMQLVWLPMNHDSMRLCWRVMLSAGRSPEHFLVLVDAETGEVFVRRSLTAHLEPASYRVYTNDSPSPFSPGWPTPTNGQPPLTTRTLVTYPLSALDTNASPAGWVPDGLNPSTTGNNADAFLWRELNVNSSTGNPIPDIPRPQASGTNRAFDFSMNLTNDDPLVYASASTAQLFWRANWYHDRLYELGFTEAAGNFQMSNFGRGGAAGDPVLCLVQAGADWGYSDNSMFYTPPDGTSGECYMFIFTGPIPNRDGSMDQEVVCHELTHGLSNRLLGGGVGISALQSEGMGEGWSDFYSLCLLSEASDAGTNANACYPEGGYASYLLAGFNFTQNYYFGIRRYPYTTDMTKNPLTFKDIDPSQASAHFGVPINPLFGGGDPSEVHNQGEVWCVTLREVWAGLVNKWGWTIGNQLTLQLVTDGLKLAPANATFLEARDGILMADNIDNGGENNYEIWTAFAKRGMGMSATCPSSDTTIGVGESFDGPTSDGILEIGITPAPWSSLFTGDTITNFVRVSDAAPVTNAVITATIVGSSNLVFLNNGIAPDVKANDGVYTAAFKAPATPGTITIQMVISAVNKATATNTYTYFIVATPPNDNFTNAIKVPASGASYVSNNKRATRETGEPAHGGTVGAASLWWNFTPAVNGNVLVDAGGSDFTSVVAVYTNNTLVTLGAVASARGSASRKGAYLNFNASAGVVYHIVVAGADSRSVGTVMLNIEPSGQPDTNAPTVTITSPLNGILIYTNQLFLSGSALDQGVNPSGIKSITFRVSSTPGYERTIVLPYAPSFNGALSTNWSGVVGLFEGLNTVEVFAADFAGNISSSVSIQATYRPLNPPNDYFANAIVLTGTAGTNSVNTIKATKEIGEPNHAGNAGGKSAWWLFTPSVDGVLTLSTTNSTFDTVMAVYTGSSVANLTPVASNDDAYSGAPGGFSRIIQAVRAGQTYHIAVDGYDGLSGVVFLTYSFAPARIFSVTGNATLGGTVTPSSSDVQSNGVIALTATPDANYQFDIWDGSALSLNNPFSFVVNSNMSVTAHFRPVAYTDGFESGNFQAIAWQFGGNKPWTVQTNVVATGSYAARSGTITDSQTTSLILSNNFRAGIGSFDYRVSSEAGFDFLKFYVNGVFLQQWSGEAGWANFTFMLNAGTNVLEWRYVKDPANSAGLDAAFIDDINLPLNIGTNSSTPAHLQLRRQSDGTFFVDLLGQTNQQYIVQTSTNLVNWQTLSTGIATGGYLRIPDPASGTNRVQFYRAVVTP